ncbi:hypothetical protein DL96DRAFT_1585316 [Flagelloscypha sp. PMI_526]|nr:hypothetical protein DL96DRAFT_1585316 [Flagelloscypha sp. PMI_526]
MWGKNLVVFYAEAVLVKARVVADEPPFGSIDEWRSAVLASRFPELAESSVWGRQKFPQPREPRRIRRAEREYVPFICNS